MWRAVVYWGGAWPRKCVWRPEVNFLSSSPPRTWSSDCLATECLDPPLPPWGWDYRHLLLCSTFTRLQQVEFGSLCLPGKQPTEPFLQLKGGLFYNPEYIFSAKSLNQPASVSVLVHTSSGQLEKKCIPYHGCDVNGPYLVAISRKPSSWAEGIFYIHPLFWVS